jgi:hypothetical protein
MAKLGDKLKDKLGGLGKLAKLKSNLPPNPLSSTSIPPSIAKLGDKLKDNLGGLGKFDKLKSNLPPNPLSSTGIPPSMAKLGDKLKDKLGGLGKLAKLGKYASPAQSLGLYVAAIKLFSELVYTLVILLCFGAFFAALYYLIYVTYPRPFKLGHTEPLEEFMKDYLADLLNSIQYCAKNKDKYIDPSISKACSDILQAKCVPVKERPDYYLMGGTRNLLTEPFYFKSDDCTPQQLPALYFYFMFYEATNGDANSKTFDEIRNLIAEDIPYAPGITSAVTRDKSLPAVKRDLSSIHKFFQSIRTPRLTVQEDTPIIDVGSTHLSLLASYRAQIWHMYDFRKDKWFLGLYGTLMYDYVEYIFKTVIKQKWSTIGRDIVDASNAMVLWFTSEGVRKFVLSIPFRIAGIDPYENAPADWQLHQTTTETFAPFTKPGDTVETLGFLKGLLELPKAFALLPQFFWTLIKFFKLLTKPFAIFRLVIGLIIGVTILIMYIVVTVVASIVFIIPATIKVVFFKILETIIWVLLFLLAAIIYFIIAGLNSLVGGALTGLLRCEDLPSAWLKYTNYMFGNKRVRQFFCNGICRAKFLTTANWCNVSNRPSQCPQQVIYQLFYESFWRKSTNPTATETNSTYDFKPDLKYMSLKSEEREKIIREHLREKYKYLEECYKNTTSWTKLTKSSNRYQRKQTHPINQDIFLQSSLSVCDFISKYGSKVPQSVREDLEYLCNETYCKQVYKPIYRSKHNTDYVVDLQDKPKYKFCKPRNDSESVKDYERVQKSPVSAFNGFITVSFGCILIAILFAIFVHIKPGNSTLNGVNVE